MAVALAALLCLTALPGVSASHGGSCNPDRHDLPATTQCLGRQPQNIREDIMQDICQGTSAQSCLAAVRDQGSEIADLLAETLLPIACPPSGSVPDCQDRIPAAPTPPPVPTVPAPPPLPGLPPLPGNCVVDAPGAGAETPAVDPQDQDIVVPLPPVTVPIPGVTFEALGHRIHQDRDEITIDLTDPVIPFGTPGVPAVPVHTGPVKVCVDL